MKMSMGRIAIAASLESLDSSEVRTELKFETEGAAAQAFELRTGQIEKSGYHGKLMPTESHREAQILTRKACLDSCAAEMHHGQAPTESCAEKRRRCKYTCKHKSTVDAVPTVECLIRTSVIFTWGHALNLNSTSLQEPACVQLCAYVLR